MQNTFQLNGPITKAEMDEFTATQDNPAPVTDEPVELNTPAIDPVIAEPANTPSEVDVLKKRYADSQRYIAEIKRKAAEKEKELLDELQKASANKPTYVSDEALKGFEEAFPDVAPFLKEYSLRAEKNAEAKAEAKAREILEARDTKAQENTEALKRLSARHPDWPEYVEKETQGGKIFASWLESQTPLINEMIQSGEVDKVILVMDLFKSQVAPKKSSGSTQRQNTQAVQSSTPADVAPNKALFDMNAWNAKWDKAMKRSNHKVMNELMADYEQAVREKRIPS